MFLDDDALPRFLAFWARKFLASFALLYDHHFPIFSPSLFLWLFLFELLLPLCSLMAHMISGSRGILLLFARQQPEQASLTDLCFCCVCFLFSPCVVVVLCFFFCRVYSENERRRKPKEEERNEEKKMHKCCRGQPEEAERKKKKQKK